MTHRNTTSPPFLDTYQAARLAHDLRSPLTVITEFASILRDGLGGPVTARQNEFLTHIESAAGDLVSLIDQRLDPNTAPIGDDSTPLEAQETSDA
jgi:K+-sensing histidine kinase KdpD